MKIKELIEKLQQMPPDGNAEFIGGIFIYNHALTYNHVSHKPEKKQEESMRLLANKHDDEMRYLVTSVTCKLNMYADSGEIDYLRKAIAVINSELKKTSTKITQNEYYYKSDGHKYYHCPNCCELIEAHDNYCRHCGQKLEWSDESAHRHQAH